jgi:hypothetical protein
MADKLKKKNEYTTHKDIAGGSTLLRKGSDWEDEFNRERSEFKKRNPGGSDGVRDHVAAILTSASARVAAKLPDNEFARPGKKKGQAFAHGGKVRSTGAGCNPMGKKK